MKNLIQALKIENRKILDENPKLAREFDWSGDAFKLQFNSEMIGKLEKTRKSNLGDMLKTWELFKKDNWYESETIDVEKMLIHKFQEIYGNQ